MSCPGCRWASTWQTYHRSYKGKRIHGGRAYEDFTRFTQELPGCRTTSARVLAIDRLIQAVHEDQSRLWTTPAACNLIAGTRDEVIALMDGLAYGDRARTERTGVRDGYLQSMSESVKPTRRHGERVRRRHARRAAQKPVE